MTASAEHYQRILEDTLDTESLTIFVVAGTTQTEVAAALQIDTNAAASDEWYVDDADVTGYALADIEGGVVAIEHTGYGDPSLAALETLSRGGRKAAVVRSNIQAHLRFGSARDGAIVFDAHQYTWVDKSLVPAELRELFDTAWFDRDAPIDEMEHNGFAVGLAMAQVITGLRLTAADLMRAVEAGYRPAPCMLYVLGLEED